MLRFFIVVAAWFLFLVIWCWILGVWGLGFFGTT